MSSLFLLALAAFSSAANAQQNAVANTCGPWRSPSVVCINKYASVMGGDFVRTVSETPLQQDTFPSTSVPNDKTFSRVKSARFLVFDSAAASSILGKSPQYDVMFNLSEHFHEAPVYAPNVNKLYATAVGPDIFSQVMIDLNVDPPVLSSVTADPPLYSCQGSHYRDGQIYYACSGNNETDDGSIYRPGLYTFDPTTNKSATLLNNYFGYYFNSADDMTMDSKGDIWFTDDDYSWLDRTAFQPPQIPKATYRFRPSTGVAQIVNTDLVEANGIGLSPDEKTLYITDTGAGQAPTPGGQGLKYTSTGPRFVYAFDVINNGTQIANKRPIYFSQEWAPDGFKVARNGYIVTGTGYGVDILDPSGILLVRIQTDFLAVNIAWAGPNLTDLWIVGLGTAARVRWALQGPALS